MPCCIRADDPAAPAMSVVEIRRPAGARRDHRGRLLHGYLHKSSNSLCGIKGYASLIAGRSAAGDRSVIWARKIIAEVERLEDAYRSVRDMAFPAPAGTAGDDAPGPVLAEACAAAASRPRNLSCGPLPQADGCLLLPAGDLRQVLAAILDNSAESRPGPVTVALAAHADGSGNLVLALADDGPGMPPELLAQALDPFVTTRPGHLGIGLARVDTIMDMHGLGWGLRSVPQAGTTVSLVIARADARRAQPRSGKV